MPKDDEDLREVPRNAEVVGARLFASQGYAETTIRQIVSELGITNGTFYYYYASKEELLLSISKTALSEIREAVATAIAGADTGLGALKSLIRTHLRVITASQDLHTTMLTELRSLTGDNRTAVLEGRRDYEAIPLGVIRQAQAEGSLRSDIDARTLTLLLLSQLNWTIFWYRADGALTADDLADRVLLLFLQGASAV